MKRHVMAVVGERSLRAGARGLEKAAAYTHSQLEACGLHCESDAFDFQGIPVRNVLGATHPDWMRRPLFVVGAHMDTVNFSPGADDNASGVAVLLEMARLLPSRLPRQCFLFVGFTLEEWGMDGSRRVARRLAAERCDVRGMLSLEMMGYQSPLPRSQKHLPGLQAIYPDTADFIVLVGNDRSAGLLQALERGMDGAASSLAIESLVVPGVGEIIPESRFSDHAMFWDAGFPAVLITDTAWLRNPHYHQPTDKVETLDFTWMSQVGSALLEGIAEALVTLSGP